MSSTVATVAYEAGASPIPLVEETLGDLLDRRAVEHPDREAVVERTTGRRWTYAQLQSDAHALAAGLLDLGVARGDRVAVLAPNVAEWSIAQFACAKLGAILVTINPAYRAGELAYALAQSGATALIAVTGFRSSDYASMITEARSQCPDLRHVLFIDSPAWSALLTRGKGADPSALASVQRLIDPGDAANIQYTSGTTGNPKGATLSHFNLLNNALMGGLLCGYGPTDRVCVPVPFHHCFGMVMGTLACAAAGATMVIPAPAFDPEATLAAVEAERCTSIYGVPTMFVTYLDQPNFARFDLSSLRTGIMAGAPCPEELVRRVVDDMGVRDLTICYGMTETSPIATQTSPADDLAKRLTSVGRVHPHVELRLVDPATGAVVDRGVPGEICVRGYSVMLGYWNEPARTRETVDDDGWLHTGDIGVLDSEGYLSVTGRLKDVVIRGGENIYPREIEDFLHTHPDVIDVHVVGVPDPHFGEELCAWVKIRAGAPEPTPASLSEFAAGKLARYKIPRYVVVVDEFPMTASGKVQKTELRKQSLSRLGAIGSGLVASA